MTQNRLLWIGAALLLFALVSAVFRLRLQQARARRKRDVEAPLASAPVQVPAVALRFDGASWLRVFGSTVAFHLRSIVREAPYLAISAIALVNQSVGIYFTSHPNESARWPVTSMIAPNIMSSTAAPRARPFPNRSLASRGEAFGIPERSTRAVWE